MANKGTIKSERPTVTEYPAEETRKAIRREDWNRIKRLVSNIRPEPKFLRTAYSAFFGAAITAGATIIPIHYVPQIPHWFLLIYIYFAGFALVLGIILLLVDIYNTSSKSTDLKSLRIDMQEIEDTFKRETGGEEEIGKVISASISASKSMPVSVSRSQSVLSKLKKTIDNNR